MSHLLGWPFLRTKVFSIVSTSVVDVVASNVVVVVVHKNVSMSGEVSCYVPASTDTKLPRLCSYEIICRKPIKLRTHVRLESRPISPKSCPKISHSRFCLNVMFSKIAQNFTKFL